MELLKKLQNRYATKVFDKTKKISQNDLEEILEAFRLSASSFGLQPWKIILVKTPETRQKLLPHSWNQSQIVDASELLVFARIEDPKEDLIEKYLNDITTKRGVSRDDLAGYEQMMKGFLNSKSLEQRNFWATRQVNIAVGSLLTFLAFKEIDSCPIEGFDPEKYDEILGLKNLGLSSVLVLPIGYRSNEDKYASLEKVRFDLKDILIEM